MARNLEIDGRKLKDIQVINAVDSDTKEYVPYIDTHDATATAEDIVEGKTAYVDGKEVVGTHSDIQSPYTSFRALVDRSIMEVTAEMLDGVTKIGDSAFQICLSLESIVIPNTVTNIDSGAFQFCTSLRSISIPENIIQIAPSAFYDCSTCTEVIYKGHVPNILNSVYATCRAIAKYDMRHATAVPTLSSTSSLGHAANCQLIVPDALYDTWKAATNWVALKDVVWVKASEYVEE